MPIFCLFLKKLVELYRNLSNRRTPFSISNPETQNFFAISAFPQRINAKFFCDRRGYLPFRIYTHPRNRDASADFLMPVM